MARNFLVTEVIECPDCKKGTCGKCANGKIEIQVPLVDVLKEINVDVPNTGYFGILTQKGIEDA